MQCINIMVGRLPLIWLLLGLPLKLYNKTSLVPSSSLGTQLNCFLHLGRHSLSRSWEIMRLNYTSNIVLPQLPNALQTQVWYCKNRSVADSQGRLVEKVACQVLQAGVDFSSLANGGLSAQKTGCSHCLTLQLERPVSSRDLPQAWILNAHQHIQHFLLRHIIWELNLDPYGFKAQILPAELTV